MGKRTYKQKITKETIENEIVDDYTDVKLPKKHKFNNGDFITIFQKTMANIALFSNLSRGEYKLLLYLIGTAGIDNSVSLDLNILCSELNEHKSNISGSLKGLVERNIIFRKDGYRYGNQPLPFELSLNYDQINYDLAYNGRIKDFKKVQYKHPEISHDKVDLLENQRNLLDEISEEEKKKSVMERFRDSSFE